MLFQAMQYLSYFPNDFGEAPTKVHPAAVKSLTFTVVISHQYSGPRLNAHAAGKRISVAGQRLQQHPRAKGVIKSGEEPRPFLGPSQAKLRGRDAYVAYAHIRILY